MARLTRWPSRYSVDVLAVTTALALMSIPEMSKGLASVLYLAAFIAAFHGGLARWCVDRATASVRPGPEADRGRLAAPKAR
jgi:hypothetical protein